MNYKLVKLRKVVDSMKYYIVKWLNEEHHFTNVKEAIICAENVAEENLCNSYVFGETTDGVRDEDPFFRCELEF